MGRLKVYLFVSSVYSPLTCSSKHKKTAEIQQRYPAHM
jgi:hypothetical protein